MVQPWLMPCAIRKHGRCGMNWQWKTTHPAQALELDYFQKHPPTHVFANAGYHGMDWKAFDWRPFCRLKAGNRTSTARYFWGTTQPQSRRVHSAADSKSLPTGGEVMPAELKQCGWENHDRFSVVYNWAETQPRRPAHDFFHDGRHLKVDGIHVLNSAMLSLLLSNEKDLSSTQ